MDLSIGNYCTSGSGGSISTSDSDVLCQIVSSWTGIGTTDIIGWTCNSGAPTVDPCQNLGEWGGIICTTTPTLSLADSISGMTTTTSVEVLDLDQKYAGYGVTDAFIPSSISQLTQLRYISLFYNFIDGEFPHGFTGRCSVV